MSELKNKITELIMEEYSDVYCNNCGNEGKDSCDECNRKSMYWTVSKDSAQSLAGRILKELGE